MIVLAGIKIETVAWSTFAPLANHLWQSTIFAGTAGLLTLLLRKNRAQTRYWLWLIASAKFLIPFSLLISLGSHLGWSKPASITQPVFTFVMQEIGQPFSPSEPDLQAKPATSRPQTLPARALLILLTTAWVCGSLAVLLAWCLRWRRLVLAMRPAWPANTGRELEVLRRLEKARGTKPIGLFSSDAALEPGIVGIVRPVLLLPAGMSDHLTDAQLEAIMTHELCHVGRRDNMIAALHMVVEAMFWFHPLVWWVGSRLVDERERACDEEVLRTGSDPQVYAQGILKVCEFCLDSPLVCVAGVTGSNLKKRIEEIMMHRIVHQLELKKKLLLAVAGTAAITLPVVFGVFHALPLPALPLRPVSSLAQSRAGQFESIYVQPNKDGTPGLREDFGWTHDSFQATNATLTMLIRWAYGVSGSQVSGGPSWIDSERYDVKAQFTKFEGDDPIQLTNHDRLQLQPLLADRFKLAIHRETRPVPIYELVLSASGPKFHEATPGGYASGPNGVRLGLGIWPLGAGEFVGQGASMASLAGFLSMQLGRKVVDKTMLTGNYDFTLHCGKDSFQKPWPSESRSAAILVAVPHDLGLQLNPQVGPVEVIIVDHAEQVSGNHPTRDREGRTEAAGATRGSRYDR
ncbi:MAG TPA: M56 family metallopeptidase [Candidatus Angelobacter sp.]|jgi:uncharacterized protein (TIGR03435 family)|nr:M56 family metallopeptidase [Candidatus Angelobacter sp.]